MDGIRLEYRTSSYVFARNRNNDNCKEIEEKIKIVRKIRKEKRKTSQNSEFNQWQTKTRKLYNIFSERRILIFFWGVFGFLLALAEWRSFDVGSLRGSHFSGMAIWFDWCWASIHTTLDKFIQFYVHYAGWVCWNCFNCHHNHHPIRVSVLNVFAMCTYITQSSNLFKWECTN